VFVPRACRPARAQTKGKDERNLGYVKHHFFVRYHAFATTVSSSLPSMSSQPPDRGWVTVPGHAAIWARTLDVERRPLAVYEEAGTWNLTHLLERMKMEPRLAQLDGVCEQAAKGDDDYRGFQTQALEAE
jgi:hypothetical protein